MSREELLLKPHWSYQDVCEYVGCKKSTAYKIMETVRNEYNGAIRFVANCVKRDSVLNYLGTSIEREEYIRKEVEKWSRQS